MDSVSLRTAFSDPGQRAVVGTLRTLYSVPDTSSSLPTFIPSADTLVAAGTSLDAAAGEFMEQLTSGAQAAARKNFNDSIVAGPLSEASDGQFPDIGIWLGSGQFQSGQEWAVLASLGLKEWIQSSAGTEAKITARQFEAPSECAETQAMWRADRMFFAWRDTSSVVWPCQYRGHDLNGLELAHCASSVVVGAFYYFLRLFGELRASTGWFGALEIPGWSDVIISEPNMHTFHVEAVVAAINQSPEDAAF